MKAATMITAKTRGRTLASEGLPVRDRDDPATGRSATFRFDIPNPTLPLEIRVTRADGSAPAQPFEILDPVWFIPRE